MSKASAAKEARQRQLIDATVTSIGRRGFAGTTLTHVAGEAGLSPGIVNFYFRSKEQLLIATLEQIAEEYEAFWRAAVAAAGDSPAAPLDAMIEADFHPAIFTHEKVSVWFAFWAEAQSQPSYRRLISKLESRYFESARAMCQRLIDEGGYAGIDAGAVAGGINAMIDGFWLDFLIDPRDFDRDEAKRTCRLFLSGLFPNEFPRPVHAAPPALATADAQDLDRAAHRARLAAALRRRVAPGGGPGVKELAAAVGVTSETVRGWLDGDAEPSSREIGLLCGLFDPLFWPEVYGPIGAALRRRLDGPTKG